MILRKSQGRETENQIPEVSRFLLHTLWQVQIGPHQVVTYEDILSSNTCIHSETASIHTTISTRRDH